MPATILIAIGASAGGVESLQRFVHSLPGDLDAAVAVVLHVPAGSRSLLAHILERAGNLPASEAVDGEPVEAGRIYVAMPDRHLLVKEDHFVLDDGPPEHSARPAVDALFRSAAASYGPRTIGAVLSGFLTDGTAGLAEIKRQGGYAMVEDPAVASHPSMPQSALEHVDVDAVGTCRALARRVTELVMAWQGDGSLPAPPS